jgi:hypothetical protein
MLNGRSTARYCTKHEAQRYIQDQENIALKFCVSLGHLTVYETILFREKNRRKPANGRVRLHSEVGLTPKIVAFHERRL